MGGAVGVVGSLAAALLVWRLEGKRAKERRERKAFEKALDDTLSYALAVADAMESRTHGTSRDLATADYPDAMPTLIGDIDAYLYFVNLENSSRAREDVDLNRVSSIRVRVRSSLQIQRIRLLQDEPLVFATPPIEMPPLGPNPTLVPPA